MTDITPARAIIPVEQLDKSILLQAPPNSHMEYGILKDGDCSELSVEVGIML